MSEAVTFKADPGNQIRVTPDPTDAQGRPRNLDPNEPLQLNEATGAGRAELSADGKSVVLHPAADGSESTIDVDGDPNPAPGRLDAEELHAVITYSVGTFATALGFKAAQELEGTPA